jgi:hypothetical protein
MRRKSEAYRRWVDAERKNKLHHFVTVDIKTRDIFILLTSKYFSFPELDVHISFIDCDRNHD